MKPATCLPNNCFCELNRTGNIIQPINTWSSAAFLLIGTLIISLALWDIKQADKNNRLKNSPFYGIIFGILVIFVGLGSIYYHARLTYLGQFFDNFGMFLITTAIFFYGIQYVYKIKPAFLLLEFFMTNLFLSAAQFYYPVTRRYLFALSVVLVLIVEYFTGKRRDIDRDSRFIYGAVGAMAIGFLIWILDITKILCNPVSLLQGHAVWHILTALAAGLIYLYYRSEKPMSLK